MNKKQAIERAKRDLPKALIRIPSKSDVRLSLKSAQPDQKYLDAVKQLGDTDELRNILQTAIKNNTLGKAPNGKQSNLEPAQWLMVRTKQFKDWFGDWENAANYEAIQKLKPISIPDEIPTNIKLVYSSLENGKNKRDGREVRFVNSTLGKILRHKGFDTSRIIPKLKEIFDDSIPLGFQKEREQDIRPDGTEHKEHRNFVGYNNYVGKIAADDKNYYVRFTVQEVKTKSKNYIPNELHSTYISDIEIYEANKFALNTTNEVGKVGTVGYDSILSDYLSKLQDNYNNSSKIVDENGEPLVVWTGTDSAFNEFKPKKIGTRTDSGMSGKGFYFGKKNYAKRYEGRKGVTRAFFLNIKNPIIVKGMGTNETVAWNSKNVKEAKERLDYWKFLSDEKKSIENLIDSIDDDYLNNLNSYDGVIRINTDENEGIKEYYNEIVIRDSSQAKQADPVTYDDEGNVIPLSERFNPEKKDIRYSLRTLDAEYEEALKTDRKKAERMLIEAADRAGFYYEGWHTSPQKFNIFEDGHRGKPWEFSIDTLSPVGWFSMEKQDGVKYGSNEYHVFLKIKNPYIISWFNANREEALKRKAEWLRLLEEVNKANPDDRRSNRAKRMEMISAKDAYEKYIERYEPFEVMRQEAKKVFESGKYPNAKTWGEALRMKLQEEGFDGVELDGTIADNNTDAQWIIPFAGGENIKSADLETYDDNGKLIPLSQRFDKASRDIRYSLKTIGGEEGNILKDTVNQKNLVFKQGKFIDFAFTNKKFYVIQNPYYNENIAYSNKEIKIFKSIPIDGNEDLIDFLTELIKNETIQNDETIRRAFKDYTSEPRFSLRSNIDASKERRSDERTWYVDNRWENNNSGRNNNESYGNSRQASNRISNSRIKRYSLRNPNGTKKTNQELWHEQQAEFAKKIEQKRQRDMADNGKGIRARAADYLDRKEYQFADRGFYLKQWQTEIEESLADDPNLADIFENGRLKEKYDAKMLLDTVHGRIQTKSFTMV